MPGIRSENSGCRERLLRTTEEDDYSLRELRKDGRQEEGEDDEEEAEACCA